MWKVQFRDLKAQYKALKAEMDKAILKVTADCDFIGGSEVEELEEELSEYVGVKHCVACANGTDALSMAMMAWGVGKNDAVFVPDFTFFSSGEIVSHCGASPVFVDVREDTFNIDPSSLETAVEKVLEGGVLTPKAVVAVDLFGLPADFNGVRSVADKYGLLVLEDGAQGFGGAIRGRKACSFGDISTTSFFPAKPLGCYGDGGAVFTDDDDIAHLVRSIRVHGKGAQKYDNVRIGLNSRLDTIQAAVLKVKLKAFKDYELNDVNEAASKYEAELNGIVETPKIPDGYISGWAQYTIRLRSKAERDMLQAGLRDKNIPTMVYYPKPMHRQQAFGPGDHYGFDCSVTERLCDTVLSLPMHPYLTEEDIGLITDSIKGMILTGRA